MHRDIPLPTRVLIVEQHSYRGVRVSLEQAVEVAVLGTAGYGEDTPEQAAGLDPDVMLLDINLPGSSGLRMTRRLRARLPECPVVILTPQPDDLEILEAMRAGAAACLARETSLRELVHTVQESLRGRTVIHDVSLSRLEARQWARGVLVRRGVPRSKIRRRLRPLTNRDWELLQGIVRGLSNEAIGRQLGISRHTVKNEVYTLYKKLGVKDRTQAALYAIRFGWADLRQPVFV